MIIGSESGEDLPVLAEGSPDFTLIEKHRGLIVGFEGTQDSIRLLGRDVDKDDLGIVTEDAWSLQRRSQTEFADKDISTMFGKDIEQMASD